MTITPSRLVKAGIESNGSGLDPTSGSVIAGHQERRLFANLNREKSDEAYDLFRNSDKSPVALEALPKAAPQAQAQSPAPPPQVQARSNGAGIKRRREEDERVEKTSITTRATRKQRLSNSHLGGQASNGSTAAEAKTNARGVKRLGGNGGLGGTGEGASGAIAKYKAQRNKQR